MSKEQEAKAPKPDEFLGSHWSSPTGAAGTFYRKVGEMLRKIETLPQELMIFLEGK